MAASNKSAAFSALTCPTRGRGHVNASLRMGVPAGAPPGHYDVRIAAADQHGQPAFCIDAAFDLA